MPYYRLGVDATEQAKKDFADQANLIEDLFYDEDGSLVLQVKKQLSKTHGLEKVSKSEFDALQTKLVDGIENAAPRQSVQGNMCLDQESEWKVESYSSRQATISQSAVRPGEMAMNVQLGGGRGDTIYIGRNNTMSQQAKLITMMVQARCENNENLAIGIVLTTERERPWLVFDVVNLRPGVWEQIGFELNHLDEKQLSRVDRINLVIMTEADEGYLFVQDIQML